MKIGIVSKTIADFIGESLATRRWDGRSASFRSGESNQLRHPESVGTERKILSRNTPRLALLVAGFLVLDLFVAKGADRRVPSEGQLQQMLQRYPDADLNKDGKLTVDELREFRRNQNVKGASSEAPAGTSTEATLEISTARPVLLNKDVHSSGTMGIFFQGGPGRFEPAGLLADAYVSKVKALNLQSLNYPGGPGHADNYHLVVGDTRIKGGSGDGENFSLDTGRNAKVVHQGFATQHYGVDFFNELCAFVDKLGIHGDLIVNMESGTLEEILWGLERLHAKRVIFGMEECNQLLKPGGLGSEKAYVAKVMSWLPAVKKKFPNIISVLDPAPVWRVSSSRGALQTPVDWNKALQTIPADEVRGYFWDRDIFRFTASKDPLGRLDQAFDEVLPDWLRQFQQAFPGKRFSVYQWGQKRTSPEFNSLFGCLFFARMYQWVITYNREHENYIAFMGLETLNSLGLTSGRPVVHYHVLELIGELFTGTPQVLETTLQGAEGVFVVCCEQRGHYTLLLINENSGEVRVPKLTVDGAAANPTFHQEMLYGKSLQSRDILREKTETKALSLKPYSVNVVSFNNLVQRSSGRQDLP